MPALCAKNIQLSGSLLDGRRDKGEVNIFNTRGGEFVRALYAQNNITTIATAYLAMGNLVVVEGIT